MKVLNVIDRNLEKVLCAVILSAMVIVIFLQIIFRFTGMPLSWTEELGRYLFVWLIYISSAMAVKYRAHIKVDVLKVVFQKKGNFVLDIISNLFFMLFAAVFTYYSWNAVYKLALIRPQFSASMHLPMWIPYLSMLVGCALMAIRLIQDTVQLVQEYRSPDMDLNQKEGDAS